jgi:uncharacterized damage-inducible protein DinB
MNEALLEAFRHNAWASKFLLDFCRDLTEEQLSATAPGTYGDIRATFHHMIRADAAYVRRLGGGGPDWIDSDDIVGFDQLSAWVDEAEQLWERFLSSPVDAERIVEVSGDHGPEEVRAGVIVAQALHHGNHHREQICAILTSLGLEPPDVQAWEYAWHTGRIWNKVAGD